MSGSQQRERQKPTFALYDDFDLQQFAELGLPVGVTGPLLEKLLLEVLVCEDIEGLDWLFGILVTPEDGCKDKDLECAPDRHFTLLLLFFDTVSNPVLLGL